MHLDRQALERYVTLEREIHKCEGKNTLKALRAKEEQLKELEDNRQRLEAVFNECVKQTWVILLSKQLPIHYFSRVSLTLV